VFSEVLTRNLVTYLLTYWYMQNIGGYILVMLCINLRLTLAVNSCNNVLRCLAKLSTVLNEFRFMSANVVISPYY